MSLPYAEVNKSLDYSLEEAYIHSDSSNIFFYIPNTEGEKIQAKFYLHFAKPSRLTQVNGEIWFSELSYFNNEIVEKFESCKGLIKRSDYFIDPCANVMVSFRLVNEKSDAELGYSCLYVMESSVIPH